ncbi:tetratricopeptide repeat protein 1-like [Tachypleus tridentatus]|uniref:tetratricopeptide repeat protein 1-like n=1 Tax=Tachypleus tridentatus TaxID=6853 RepID=UPI003FCFACF3
MELNKSSNASDYVPSNEEIIEELTKDLEVSLSKQEVNEGSEENNRSSISTSHPPSSDSVYPQKSHEGFKEEQEHSSEPCCSNIFQDNEQLYSNMCQKDNEQSVSQEENSQESENSIVLEEEDEEIVVDEEYLKDLETTMTEDEKLIKKEEAQSLKNEGNEKFRDKQYLEAIKLYSKALQICPLSFTKERSTMYSNRAACRAKLEQNEEAISDCTKALDLNPSYLKAILRRAQLHKTSEKLDEALTDYQQVLEIDPNILEAREACMVLPEQIKERNEKLKTEMLGKLKDLGNMILRPFGLSTDNFKVVQDPNTGGYSVNFQNNKH